jgi:competence ComEA-like helix-hairpin-helix protein
MRMLGWIVAVTAVIWCAGTSGSALASTDSPHAKGDAKETSSAEHKVNINEAGQAELMKLEGVGAGAAKKIIAWREAHGPFKRLHDLEKVPGVGRDVLEKNHGRIAVK